MKEDIEHPIVENVGVAVIPEIKDGEDSWMVYLLNMNDGPIDNVLISSRGYGTSVDGESKKTSVLRHHFEHVEGNDFVQVELIMAELFALHNEFWVSYYIGKDIYDKKFIFPAESIEKQYFTTVPLLDKPGILHL